MECMVKYNPHLEVPLKQGNFNFPSFGIIYCKCLHLVWKSVTDKGTDGCLIPAGTYTCWILVDAWWQIINLLTNERLSWHGFKGASTIMTLKLQLMAQINYRKYVDLFSWQNWHGLNDLLAWMSLVCRASGLPLFIADYKPWNLQPAMFYKADVL